MPQNHPASNEKPFTATEDETLNCCDCKNDFVFTVGEQEFFIGKGFTNRPRRCRECQKIHKANKNDRQPRR